MRVGINAFVFAMNAELPTPSASPARRVFTDPGSCPVCGASNQCRMESGAAYKGRCWCEGPVVDAAALRRLLGDLPETRCLCAECLFAIAANPGITWEELASRRA